jgi:hypothetical protein
MCEWGGWFCLIRHCTSPPAMLPYEVDLYQDWHKRCLDVLPGITDP